MANQVIDIDAIKDTPSNSQLDMERMLKNPDILDNDPVVKTPEKDVEKIVVNDDEEEIVAEENQDSEEDESEENEEVEESSVLGTIYKSLGEIEGINIKEYTNDIEGFIKLNSDVAEIKSKTLADKTLNDLFKADPELEEFYNHRREGKSLDTYIAKKAPSQDSKIDLSTEDGQKRMISLYYKEINGLNDKAINALINTSENDGTLEDEAKSLKKQFESVKKQEVAEREKQEAVLYKQQQEEDIKIVETAKTIVRSGNVAGLKLKPSQVDEFEKQMLTVTESGNSLVNETYMNLSLENRLKADFLVMNLDKLDEIFKLNKSKSNTTLDKLFEENKSRSSVKPKLNKSENQASNFNLASIDFNNVEIE